MEFQLTYGHFSRGTVFLGHPVEYIFKVKFCQISNFRFENTENNAKMWFFLQFFVNFGEF